MTCYAHAKVYPEQMKPSNSSYLEVKYFIDGQKHENIDIFSSVSDKTGRLSTLELTNMSVHKGRAGSPSVNLKGSVT